MKTLALGLIRLYQKTLSVWLPPSCRSNRRVPSMAMRPLPNMACGAAGGWLPSASHAATL